MSNNNLLSNNFFNSVGAVFSFDGVLNEIASYVSGHPTSTYELVVGTDSRASGDALYVTTVVIRRIGNGGRFFYTKTLDNRARTMRDRIWRETMLSITLAQEVRSRLGELFGEEFLWDHHITFHHIHLDVGTTGATRDLVDGVSGMVKGYGFEPVIKPASYGAFAVADLYT